MRVNDILIWLGMIVACAMAAVLVRHFKENDEEAENKTSSDGETPPEENEDS